MSVIKVRCIDQTLRFENTPVIASGDRAVDFVEFEFCSKWDGYVRTAVFWRSDGVPYHVLLDENDTCEIPKEVLTAEGLVYFGAFGVNQATDQHERPPRRTTEVLTYRIVKGAITTGTQPSDPTPAIYDQLLAQYAELAAKYMELHDTLPYKADLVEGKIPASQLPAFVDDVLEFTNRAAFPATGEGGKLYVDLDENLTYRWSGSTYVEVPSSLALGETSSTAYRGDRGKAAYNHSQIINGNPHGTTAEQTGAVPTTRTINGRTLATDLRLPIIEVSEEEPEDPQDGDVWLDLSDEGVEDDAVRYSAQTLTEAQKAQARANIGATAGEDVEFADSVEWLNENGDTSKKYVLPDGYIYSYTQKTIMVEHNANDGTGILNAIPTGAWGNGSPITKTGGWTSPVIRIDPANCAPTSARTSESEIVISGIEKVVPFYNNYSIVVYYYKADGSQLYMKAGTNFSSIPTNGEIPLPFKFTLKDSNFFADSNWATVAGVRVSFGVSSSSITADDVKNLKVSMPYFNTEQTVSGWYSTGQQHSNDKATQQNSADIAALKERTATLESDVGVIKEIVDGMDLIDIHTGQALYAVGDSITYGYGIGGNDYSWVKHVIDHNGYNAANCRNLGQSGLGFCSVSTSGNTITDVVGGTNFSGADVVTVALGINDWKNLNATLTEFWEGMQYCFNKIRTDNPYCKIFYILPFNARFLGTFDTFYCLGATGDSNKERPYAYTLQAFVNMIKDKFEEDAFKAFHVHVIDMVECPAINRYNITTALIDYTHPSAETNVELGKEIARRIALA